MSIMMACTPLYSFAAESDCELQQIITPAGLAKLSQNAIRKKLDAEPNALRDAVDSGLKGKKTVIPSSLPNILIDGHLNEATSMGKVDHVLSRTTVPELQLGSAAVTCEPNRKCKLKVPLEKLGIETNYKILCREPRCSGIEIVEFENLKLGFDQTKSAHPPMVEFDVDIRPGVPLKDAIRVDPASVKFDIPVDTLTALEMDLAIPRETWLKIYDKLNTKEHPVCFSNDSKTPLRDLVKQMGNFDEIAIKQAMDELKPYLKSESSFLVAVLFIAGSEIARAAVKAGRTLEGDERQNMLQLEAEVSKIVSKLLSDRLGPSLANTANKAIEDAKVLQEEYVSVLPVYTPKQLASPIDVAKDKTLVPQMPHEIRVKKTSFSPEGNFVIHATSCSPEDLVITSARRTPAPGSEVSGAVPVRELNRYLGKMTANRSQDQFTLRAGGNGVIARIVNRKSAIDVTKLETITVKDKDGVERPYVHFSFDETVTSNSPLSKLKNLVTRDNQKINEGFVEIVTDQDGKLRLDLEKGKFKRKIKNKDALAFMGNVLSGAMNGLFVGQHLVNAKYRSALSEAYAKGYAKVDLRSKIPYKITNIEVSPDGSYLYFDGKVDEVPGLKSKPSEGVQDESVFQDFRD